MRALTYLSVMVEANETHPAGALFAGRLRDLDVVRLIGEGATEATDETSGARVLVAIEKKSRVQSLSGLVSVEHAHLAKVVDVLDHDDSWLVLSRPVQGTKLRARVAEIGRKHAVDAVRTALRVADALHHLHEAKITHGRVNPDNVLLALEQGVDPVLIYGTPSTAEYLRPGDSDAALDFRDDTWAATALLYFMLVGSPPPAQGLETIASLEAFNIDDNLLCEVLLHGLARDEARRAKNLTALRRELARWFIAHAADEPVPMANVSHIPPPLPQSVAPRSRRSVSSPEKAGNPVEVHSPGAGGGGRGWLRSLPFTVVAAVVGITAAWGLVTLTRSTTKSVRLQERAVVTSSVPSGPIDLAEVPVTGQEDKNKVGGDPTANCVAGYLREGTLTKTAQLDPICKESELPRVLGVLRMTFASTANPASGAPRFDNLGWYSLPLLSGLRKACCPDPLAMKLPDLGGSCPEFEPALDALGQVASTTQQFDSALHRYSDAATCAARTGRATGISAAPPSPASERTFRDLFIVANTP
jgi:hypothetical protein